MFAARGVENGFVLFVCCVRCCCDQFCFCEFCCLRVRAARECEVCSCCEVEELSFEECEAVGSVGSVGVVERVLWERDIECLVSELEEAREEVRCLEEALVFARVALAGVEGEQ